MAGSDGSRQPAEDREASASEAAPGAAASDTASESTEAERSGQLPMPSPWAVAVAALAVLAFGIAIGTVVGRHRRRPDVVLADEPTSASANATPSSEAAATGSEPEAEETTSEPEAEEAGSEEEPESGEETEEESESESEPSSKGGSKSSSKGSEGSGSKGSGTGDESESEGSGSLPPIKHVFVVMLGQQGFNAVWGAGSKAPYLGSTLRKQGELIDDFYAAGSSDLVNGIALLSGQGPTPQTEEDCPTYAALAPGTVGKEEQALGAGCVYPSSTQTLPGELEKASLTWRAYVQGLEDGEGTKSCRRPTLGEADPAHVPSASSPYVTWRDPFVYFSSIVGAKSCEADDVGLETLEGNLKNAATTPTLSYIAPDACDDGSETPCAPGKPAGLAPMDAFLEEVVPAIERSGAYREDGLIAITFSEAPQSGQEADSSGCCVTSAYPNVEASTTSTSSTSSSPATASTSTSTSTSTTSSVAGSPSGGGRVGMLLISKFVKPNTTELTGQYNDYSLLLSIESLFKLKPLGYASSLSLLGFESSVYTAYK